MLYRSGRVRPNVSTYGTDGQVVVAIPVKVTVVYGLTEEVANPATPYLQGNVPRALTQAHGRWQTRPAVDYVGLASITDSAMRSGRRTQHQIIVAIPVNVGTG